MPRTRKGSKKRLWMSSWRVSSRSNLRRIHKVSSKLSEADTPRLLDVPESGTLPVEYMYIHAVTAPTSVDETEQWEDFMDIDHRNEQFSDSDMTDVILRGVKRPSENNCSGHGPSVETTYEQNDDIQLRNDFIEYFDSSNRNINCEVTNEAHMNQDGSERLIIEKSSNETSNRKKEDNHEKIELQGRRIVDIQHFIDSLIPSL
ncbi:hypothetical protein JTB14_007475 [Gonioctena quinquepunctata]|nr:hypothetical protein JTB14_007475 [Gonioctena quinquepunctata]